MEPNLVGATTEPGTAGIVMGSTTMNSVSTVASSSVIFLDSGPIIQMTNDQPDILQQALEAALPSASSVTNATATMTSEVPTTVSVPITYRSAPVAKENNFVTVFNSRDGTLRLSQENARALGISSNEG